MYICLLGPYIHSALPYISLSDTRHAVSRPAPAAAQAHLNAASGATDVGGRRPSVDNDAPLPYAAAPGELTAATPGSNPRRTGEGGESSSLSPTAQEKGIVPYFETFTGPKFKDRLQRFPIPLHSLHYPRPRYNHYQDLCLPTTRTRGLIGPAASQTVWPIALFSAADTGSMAPGLIPFYGGYGSRLQPSHRLSQGAHSVEVAGVSFTRVLNAEGKYFRVSELNGRRTYSFYMMNSCFIFKSFFHLIWPRRSAFWSH